MQNSEEMLFLLLAVRYSSGVSSAQLSQLGYAGIGRLSVEAMKAGWIQKSGSGFQLTDKGRAYIDQQNDLLGRQGLDREIAKLPGALCEQISVNSIYLPEDF